MTFIYLGYLKNYSPYLALSDFLNVIGIKSISRRGIAGCIMRYLTDCHPLRSDKVDKFKASQARIS